MALLAAILLFAALFFGFLALTAYERRRGARVLGNAREALDREVERVGGALRHIDVPTLSVHLLRTGSERLLHDGVHLVLYLVRLTERLLTRAARYLRGRQAAVPESGDPLKDALARFKAALKSEETTVE